MLAFPALDVAIGVCFIYLLLSLICTTLNEMIAGCFKTRAEFLEKGITQLLGDVELCTKLYAHPLIQSLSTSDTGSRPSYIPADKFATALMDIVTGPGKSPMDIAAFHAGRKMMGNKNFQAALGSLLDDPGLDAAKCKLCIEQWFNDGMDRVSGWYKRNAQKNALLLAVLVTLVLNVDTIKVVNLLWSSPSLRAAVIDAAKARNDKESAKDLSPMVEYENPNEPTSSVPRNVPTERVLTESEQLLLGELAGWKEDLALNKDFGSWLLYLIQSRLLGWMMTILAVSLGAPFWFDTLNRFMNIRNSGRSPNEARSKNTASIA